MPPGLGLWAEGQGERVSRRLCDAGVRISLSVRGLGSVSSPCHVQLCREGRWRPPQEQPGHRYAWVGADKAVPHRNLGFHKSQKGTSGTVSGYAHGHPSDYNQNGQSSATTDSDPRTTCTASGSGAFQGKEAARGGSARPAFLGRAGAGEGRALQHPAWLAKVGLESHYTGSICLESRMVVAPLQL